MKASARNLHYVLGMGSVVFLLTSAVTGLLWAYAPYLYWQPGYLEKKQSPAASDLLAAQPDLARLIIEAKEGAARSDSPVSAALRTDAGMVLFEVTFKNPDYVVLYDAAAGVQLSPLSAELAERFARQYVAGEPAVSEAKLHQPWAHRKGKLHQAAWVIRFADDRATEIVIDAASGTILEDSDTVRRRHFQVMELHQFNFFGTKKVLTAVSGVPLLILGITGSMIGWKRFRARSKRKSLVREGRSGR